MVKMFVELLRESVLVQGSIALTLIGTIAYMYINQMEVPSELMNILLLILGFYFGGKVERRANRKVQNYEKDHLHINSDRRGRGG